MARKPDVPCSACGNLLWSSGRGSLPASQRMCHPCRRKKPRQVSGEPSGCASCGHTFTPRKRTDGQWTKTCSHRCARRAIGTARLLSTGPCVDCGASTPRTTSVGRLCSSCSATRKRAYWQRKNLSRRADGEPLSVSELGDRDAWRCHLCRRKVNPHVKWPRPMSPSRDHLVPVADGGSNDSSNLALAHLRCNVRRSTGGTVQLLLVG